jgi:hypothetical protein
MIVFSFIDLQFCDFKAGPTVDPPPFEPMLGSYAPGLTGVALYFTDTGEKGRYSPRYPSKSNKSDEKVSCSMVMFECVLSGSFLVFLAGFFF